MTWGTAIILAVGFVGLALLWAPFVLQHLAHRRDWREYEVREERRRRESEVEQAIARRRREKDRTSPAAAPDAAGG